LEYYYTNSENIKDNELIIRDDEAKHLATVLRKKTSENIFVTDGNYNIFECVIKEIKNDSVRCEIKNRTKDENEPSIKIYLFPALLKNPSRFEFIIEKCCEIGVYEINPIITEHVISKTRDKSARWQQIALSAMKQSRRSYLPKINHPINFSDIINVPKSATADLRLIGNEEDPVIKREGQINIIADERPELENISLKDLKAILTDKKEINIFIGPEGGFSEKEISLALQSNFNILNLGKRKLRSETAAIVVCGVILVS
jgi:16S rRNA (uracil1498-N3)-methyltransferase